jgi:hypothetical protein
VIYHYFDIDGWLNYCISLQARVCNIECSFTCRDLFKNLKILPFYSQDILSPLLFVVDNRSMYILNSDIHNINTRQKLNIHTNIHQKYLYIKKEFTPSASKCSVISLKVSKKATDNIKQFRTALKHYLLTHSFYSLDKYFNVIKQ